MNAQLIDGSKGAPRRGVLFKEHLTRRSPGQTPQGATVDQTYCRYCVHGIRQLLSAVAELDNVKKPKKVDFIKISVRLLASRSKQNASLQQGWATF